MASTYWKNLILIVREMGVIDETGATALDWDESEVYQVETWDLAQGGLGGISNRASKELALRTRNLHSRTTALEDGMEQGFTNCKDYTDAREVVIRRDYSTADSAVLNNSVEKAKEMGNAIKITYDNLLSKKVDKEAGKGLSANDFTTVERGQLAQLVRKNIPELLLYGRVNADGSYVGKGFEAHRTSQGKYMIRHSIGHTSYSVVASNHDTNLAWIGINAIDNNFFEIISRTDRSTYIDSAFYLQVFEH